jgi:osmotically-inducible protein OsmY
MTTHRSPIPADPPRMADLARAIEEALRLQAVREARQIRVSVDGSTVKLSGLVNSKHERETVEHIARQAPGVSAVVNELLVI